MSAALNGGIQLSVSTIVESSACTPKIPEYSTASDNTVSGADEAGGLAPFVETTTTYTLGGVPSAATIDADDDGAALEVSVVVDFPFGTGVDNASQAQRLDLSDVAVVLEQTDATP